MSVWLGNIGDHISADVIVKGYIYRKAWGPYAVKIILLEDNDNNIITIRSPSKLNVGKRWRIDGKVENQSIYNGQYQTHISNWGLMLSKEK